MPGDPADPVPFPGCESRRVDLHHIQHWVNGGPTDLANLISLCPWHHKLVHDRGYLITAPPAGSDTFAFSDTADYIRRFYEHPAA